MSGSINQDYILSLRINGVKGAGFAAAVIVVALLACQAGYLYNTRYLTQADGFHKIDNSALREKYSQIIEDTEDTNLIEKDRSISFVSQSVH